MDLPASTVNSYSALESQKVVRVDFHDSNILSYEQSFNKVLASTERNDLSVEKSMWLSVGSFLLTIPNEYRGSGT